MPHNERSLHVFLLFLLPDLGLVPASISEPPPFKCLLINKVDGSCKTFNDSEQEDLQGSGVCLDPVYDVIWRQVWIIAFKVPIKILFSKYFERLEICLHFPSKQNAVFSFLCTFFHIFWMICSSPKLMSFLTQIFKISFLFFYHSYSSLMMFGGPLSILLF